MRNIPASLLSDTRLMRTLNTLCLLLACIVMFGCTASPVAPEAKIPLLTATLMPRFVITSDNNSNELTVTAQDETAFVDVHSQSGIGSAAVELVSGTPLQDIVLRLHLRGLEQFRLFYDGTVVTASVDSNDVNNIIESATSPEGEEYSLTPDSSLWLDIRVVSAEAEPRIPLDQGHFEIMLPKDFLGEEHRSFSIEWIDFYR
jgi:hypothetical protein